MALAKSKVVRKVPEVTPIGNAVPKSMATGAFAPLAAQQWICAKTVLDVNPAKFKETDNELPSKVTVAAPLPPEVTAGTSWPGVRVDPKIIGAADAAEISPKAPITKTAANRVKRVLIDEFFMIFPSCENTTLAH